MHIRLSVWRRALFLVCCVCLLGVAACGPSATQVALDLASEDPARRRAALDALDGEPQRAAALSALADTDASVRGEAATILAAIENREERTALVQRQLATGEHPAAFVDVVRAWGPSAAATLDAAAEQLQDPAHRAVAVLLAWEIEPSRSSASVIGPLLAQIAATPSMPAVMAPDLARHPDALPYLVSRAADPSPRVRRAVASWLGRAGNPAATPLLALLDDVDLSVRGAAVAALGPLADARIAPALLGVLDNLRELETRRAEEELDRRDAAASETEDGDAPPEFLDVNDVQVDMSAEQPLEQVTREALVLQGSAAVRPLLASDTLKPIEALELVKRIGASAVPELLAMLIEPPGDQDDRVLEVLRELPDPRSVDPLITVLQRRGASGELAAQALMSVGAPAAPRCASLLGAPQADLRRACLTVVAATNDPTHVPALRAALADRDTYVARTAAGELGRLRDPGAFDALVGMLRHAEYDRRQSAASALGSLGDVRAAGPLAAAITRLDHNQFPDAEPAGPYTAACGPGDERYSEPEGNYAGDALVELGAPAVPAVLAALSARPRAEASARLLDALARMPKAYTQEEVMKALRASLEAPGITERAAAARALVAIRPAGWLDLLLENFAREQKRAASGGQALGDFVMALGRSETAQAAQALVAAAPRLRKSWTDQLVFAALAQNRSEPARAFLDARLQAKDLDAVIGGHDYYIRYAPPGAEAALLAALADGGELGALDLACVLINSGNAKLEAAARRWANEAGYSVMRSYGGGGGASWGAGR